MGRQSRQDCELERELWQNIDVAAEAEAGALKALRDAARSLARAKRASDAGRCNLAHGYLHASGMQYDVVRLFARPFGRTPKVVVAERRYGIALGRVRRHVVEKCGSDPTGWRSTPV